MSEGVRNFPRHQAINLSCKLENGTNVDLLNLSLGGIGLKTPMTCEGIKICKATVILGKQLFKLQLKLIWEMKFGSDSDSHEYRSGWSLLFQDEQDYRKWLALMQALYRTQMRIAST